MPINDGWLRDWGPTCIARPNPETGKREVAGVHWDYDCYGAPGKIAREPPTLEGMARVGWWGWARQAVNLFPASSAPSTPYTHSRRYP